MNLSFQILQEPIKQTMSHTANKLGLTSIVTGGSVAAAEHSHLIEKGNTLAEWVLVVTFITGLLFTVKLLLDIAIGYKTWKGK